MLNTSSTTISTKTNKLFGIFTNKAVIGEEYLVRHDRELRRLESLQLKMNSFFQVAWIDKEFSAYCKIKSALAKKNMQSIHFQGTVILLQAALVSQNSFLRTSQIEGQFFSPKQQELYQFVQQQVNTVADLKLFTANIRSELARILPLLNTEEGKMAMQSYIEEITKIAGHEIGLQLFSRFKESDFTDFAILRMVSEMLNTMKNQKLLELESVQQLMNDNNINFMKLGEVLGMQPDQNTPATHAKIFHFIGLEANYGNSFGEFQEFLTLLRQWENSYKSLVDIRHSFHPDQYKIPKNFNSVVPGADMYKMFRSHLVSK